MAWYGSVLVHAHTWLSSISTLIEADNNEPLAVEDEEEGEYNDYSR